MMKSAPDETEKGLAPLSMRRDVMREATQLECRNALAAANHALPTLARLGTPQVALRSSHRLSDKRYSALRGPEEALVMVAIPDTISPEAARGGKEKVPATLEWARAFMAEASPHLGALCCFMFLTGTRVSDALWR